MPSIIFCFLLSIYREGLDLIASLISHEVCGEEWKEVLEDGSSSFEWVKSSQLMWENLVINSLYCWSNVVLDCYFQLLS